MFTKTKQCDQINRFHFILLFNISNAVSSLPDSAKFTSDCSKLIIAVEGEVRNVGGTVVDPEGGVVVVDFGTQGPDAANDPRKTFVDFTYFNNQ